MSQITLEPGQVSQLSPLVRRIVAPNPSVMTGPGTNTYLVGTDEVAVIDPGPADASHIEAILRAGGDKIRWILVTHTHTDHSPGVAPLLEAINAETWGQAAPDAHYQDLTFKPDHSLAHGDVLKTHEFSIRAVHTPGHVESHFCFLVEPEGMLMTGDHIMSGSTVVIIPPSGDMKDYLDSLQALHGLPLRHLAPGHGELIDDPYGEIDRIIAHRLKREEKVVAALIKSGGGDLDDLVSVAYDDTPASLHHMARYSLHAHLDKLVRDGRASVANNRWWLNGE